MSILAGCAIGADTPVINQASLPALQSSVASAPVADLGLDGEVLALAFSGGGARSAAFSYGALLELRARRRADGVRWIDRIAYITAVSGGGYTAAWFGLYGPDGLENFRPAFLDKNWQGQVRDNPISPANWFRLATGGLNGPDRIADWLDNEAYHGARMKDLSGPPILINAVEVHTGALFVFAGPWSEALCSDLGEARVADAVAASSAYPFAVRPLAIASYGETCPTPLPGWVVEAARGEGVSLLLRDTARAFLEMREVGRSSTLHLLDGGIVDNFGLSGLETLYHASGRPYGPLLAPADAVRIRRLRLIVVNGERPTPRRWGRGTAGPTGLEVMGAVADHAPDAARRNAYDMLTVRLARWQAETIAWRCGLSVEEARALGAPRDWNCADLTYSAEIMGLADLAPDQARDLFAMPTRLSLTADQIDRAVLAGRDAISARLP